MGLQILLYIMEGLGVKKTENHWSWDNETVRD